MPVWRDVLRLAVAWIVMSALVVWAGIGLDLAATDREPGMSTAPVAVFVAPLLGCAIALLVYVCMSIKGRETRDSE